MSKRVLCSIVVVLLPLAGCGKKGGSEEGADTARSASPVQTSANGLVVLRADAPELRQLTVRPVEVVSLPGDEVVATARIEANPNRIAHAVLPVPGRIVRVMVKLGDAVSKGQPLVTIESPTISEAQTALVQAEGALRQAQVTEAKADADLVRLSDLLEHQAVAQKDVLAAKTTADLAKAAVDQARSSRDQARRHLELLGARDLHTDQMVTVTAPLSGKVLQVSAVDGEFRNDTSSPLITIADLSRVWATSEVPESKIRYCKVGGPANLELIAFPGEAFHARVTRIADTVDSETRTVKVSAELENSGGRLRPEMFGSLRSSDGMVSTPWVPATAVVRVGDKDYVFVERGRGRFQLTPVDLGQRQNDGYAIVKGANVGDRIVTQGAIYLKSAL